MTKYPESFDAFHLALPMVVCKSYHSIEMDLSRIQAALLVRSGCLVFESERAFSSQR